MLSRLVPAAALALTAGTLARLPYPEAPPPAHTGGFGEPTCLECHFDGPLDDAAGSLTLAGVPDAYEPGRTYRLTLTLARPGMARGGFELAARFAGGERAGRQAGALRPVDDSVAVSAHGEPAVGYAHHTLSGTALAAPGTARWVLEWTAPAAGGDVVFHAAANAANDDASPFGDWIYTTRASSRARE